jgi:glucuronate isomerase
MLNPYRFFDSDKEIRAIAYELYNGIKNLPIISPHGHVDPALLAENKPFSNPAELLIIPDHYITRMLYSQGVALETVGIPTRVGEAVENDPRKIWQIFSENYHLFSGTPIGVWLAYELAESFNISLKLNAKTAQDIYDLIQQKLKAPEFLPRALYERFNIEVLSTTDSASDSLQYHKIIKTSDWNGKVIPAFRPDAVTDIGQPNWRYEINKLSDASGIDIGSFKSFIAAMENRRSFFKAMGATATDQGVLSPYTHLLSEEQAEKIFQNALAGKATQAEASLFTAHMLMEMARMSIEDGMVMQIHPGSFRNHNRYIYQRFGADAGCDIPIQTEYTHNLSELLNTYGNDKRLSLIVFTLDESNYSRELAPLAGHYPALKLGPPWWFHDSIQGMTRFREQAMETAGIYNTVGFNDDTRAFLSIPARHDLSRRMDCNWLAGLVARHIIEMEDAKQMSVELAYHLTKRAYKL